MMKMQPVLCWLGYVVDDRDGQLCAAGLAVLGAKVVVVILPVPANSSGRRRVGAQKDES